MFHALRFLFGSPSPGCRKKCCILLLLPPLLDGEVLPTLTQVSCLLIHGIRTYPEQRPHGGGVLIDVSCLRCIQAEDGTQTDHTGHCKFFQSWIEEEGF